jgi:serine/threonine protein kinase
MVDPVPQRPQTPEGSVPSGPPARPSEAPTLAPEQVAHTETAAKVPTSAEPAAGAPRDWPTVADYEILAELGRGGMGVVYKARQLQLNRLVALKMILVGAHAGPDHVVRFRTEAQAVARLRHPNIVQIYEIGDQGGLPFLALELIEGPSLEHKLAAAPLTPHQAARLTEILARAVHHAHKRGVVHRDLKPANILWSADGTVKITDFGLAKRLDGGTGPTQSGVILGTPSYMAPEQADGKHGQVGPACDVYALGAMLSEMIAGRPPFQSRNQIDIVLQVLTQEPVPPSRYHLGLPPELEAICLKCLEKDPGRRYASAHALADDLRTYLAGQPVAAAPRSSKKLKRPSPTADEAEAASQIAAARPEQVAEIVPPRSASGSFKQHPARDRRTPEPGRIHTPRKKKRKLPPLVLLIPLGVLVAVLFFGIGFGTMCLIASWLK